ncbi:ElyC/SanA/YdcF family protein [Treponema sp.]|uniref:ElyC/SanA/YdcF family protein n=1 Tax=Treponema sp. TaxID=166 RepID=UPI00298E5089|nr:ElyC/SanA/YdcF family protein [Treponema sp.]MCQ2241690.1 YdcF family protein [Treponema sp.]
MSGNVCDDVNILGRFCGQRDVDALTQDEIKKILGKPKADVMVLFGGSILAGGEVFAEAIRNGVAGTYIIVGGAGYTTQALRNAMHDQFPELETDGRTEAELFNDYLKMQYGISADYLEVKSTNCGNNITYLLEILKNNDISCESIILCQDATMQKRMEATLRKYEPEMRIINYASYRATVREDLSFEEDIWGMWDFERYLSLLMGEIPRLTDDENGYGPSGKNFIAHVEIPLEVKDAFLNLQKQYKNLVREANPAYAG